MKTTNLYHFNLPDSTDNVLATFSAFNSNFAIIDTFDTIIAKSIGANGYIKYKSGLIMQWGVDVTGSDTYDPSKNYDLYYSHAYVPFIIPFTKLVFYIGSNQNKMAAAWASRITHTLTSTDIYYSGWDKSTDLRTIKWFAMGI